MDVDIDIWVFVCLTHVYYFLNSFHVSSSKNARFSSFGDGCLDITTINFVKKVFAFCRPEENCRGVNVLQHNVSSGIFIVMTDLQALKVIF